jgi:hypothetical protein
MPLSPFGKFLLGAVVEWIFTAPAQSSTPPSRRALPSPRRALPPARKENSMPRVDCSNTILHPKPFYLNKKIYWWGGKPMCRRCFRPYSQNIRLIRR